MKPQPRPSKSLSGERWAAKNARNAGLGWTATTRWSSSQTPLNGEDPNHSEVREQVHDIGERIVAENADALQILADHNSEPFQT